MLPAVPGWSHVESPMQPEAWEVALADHPDGAYCTYLVKGLREGFRIGFGYGSCQCTGAGSNMHSAEERPSIITEFLASELRVGQQQTDPVLRRSTLHASSIGLSDSVTFTLFYLC